MPLAAHVTSWKNGGVPVGNCHAIHAVKYLVYLVVNVPSWNFVWNVWSAAFHAEGNDG